MADYNPYILGFVRQGGHFSDLWLPLQEALERYGDLPSRYGLLPEQSGRRQRRRLNLALGTTVNRLLEQSPDLKGTIHDFYVAWHRDWGQEFGIDYRPLFNRTDGQQVADWMDRNRHLLAQEDHFSLRETLAASGAIRQDVLNSIADSNLLEKAIEILQRKEGQRRRAGIAAMGSGQELVRRLQLRRHLDRLSRQIGVMPSRIEATQAMVYADELARWIGLFCDHAGIPCDELPRRNCRGVAFEFAGRDHAFLDLGSRIGDCTARPYRQIDRHTENIYWTVFPWLLDRNYQVLKVYHDDHLLMKIHLLPLATYESGGLQIFLAIDAIETGLAMRHDIEGEGKLPSATVKEVLDQTRLEILRIADAMGIGDVYAELFSNNPLVRTWLQGHDRIFLDVTRLHKVDDLEDVFSLGSQLARSCGSAEPDHLFMEIQFRNTQLMSHQTQRRNIKGFASLRRRMLSGLAMGNVIGV